MLVFLKCVAEASAEKGVRGLAGMVPGGQYAYDLALGTLEKYRRARNQAELRADIEQLAHASFEDARKAAAEAAKDAAPDASPEDRLTLELFLTQIPGAARQSLKRSDDPLGLTVPAAFALQSADDVLKILPSRPPQFRPGDPLPGKPGWVLAEPLGAGGFGEVWLAKHPKMASLAGAVKFCHGAHARDLLHEGGLIDRVMQHGEHPNVVPLLDAHLEGDAPWLMFKYVPGGDLADLVHEWQGVEPGVRVGRVVAALRELAAAVGQFHAMMPAVVHRDLKPSNILRDKSTGKLRITDFGIGAITAKAALAEESRGSTTRGGRLLSYLRGSYTPLYSSPQQRDGADPDPRDDVHALGVIGYQMLTGHLNQGAGPDFADDLRDAGAPDELIALLGRCVAQKADRRPKTAGELVEALQVPPPVLIPTPPPPTPPSPAPPPSPFRVMLQPSFNSVQKIAIIKAVRELTGMGLAEAKRFVENTPSDLGTYPDRSTAETAVVHLTRAGAVTTLEPSTDPIGPPREFTAEPLTVRLLRKKEEQDRAVQTVYGCGCLVGVALIAAGILLLIRHGFWSGGGVVAIGLLTCGWLLYRMPVRR